MILTMRGTVAVMNSDCGMIVTMEGGVAVMDSVIWMWVIVILRGVLLVGTVESGCEVIMNMRVYIWKKQNKSNWIQLWDDQEEWVPVTKSGGRMIKKICCPPPPHHWIWILKQVEGGGQLLTAEPDTAVWSWMGAVQICWIMFYIPIVYGASCVDRPGVWWLGSGLLHPDVCGKGEAKPNQCGVLWSGPVQQVQFACYPMTVVLSRHWVIVYNSHVTISLTNVMLQNSSEHKVFVFLCIPTCLCFVDLVYLLIYDDRLAHVSHMTVTVSVSFLRRLWEGS